MNMIALVPWPGLYSRPQELELDPSVPVPIGIWVGLAVIILSLFFVIAEAARLFLNDWKKGRHR